MCQQIGLAAPDPEGTAGRSLHTPTHAPADTSLLLSTARLPLFITCIVPSLCCPLLISSCFSFPLVLPVLSQSVLLNLSFFCWQFLYFLFSLFQSYFFFTSRSRLFSLHFFSISPYAAATVRNISDLPGWGFHGDGPTEVAAKALWWPTLFLIADSPVTAERRELYRHPDCIEFVKGGFNSASAYHLSTFACDSRVRWSSCQSFNACVLLFSIVSVSHVSFNHTLLLSCRWRRWKRCSDNI